MNGRHTADNAGSTVPAVDAHDALVDERTRREERLRRMAARRRLRLEKCRRRDPGAPNYGTYQLVALYREGARWRAGELFACGSTIDNVASARRSGTYAQIGYADGGSRRHRRPGRAARCTIPRG